MKLATCVIHAAHVPARVPLMARLRDQLGTPPGPYYEETTRAKYWVWHQKSINWFLEQDATHALTLQDDVEVCPDFWAVVTAMIEARPDEIIALDCAHPGARIVAEIGKPGFTTDDCMIGIGHIEPISIVRDFDTWRREECLPNTVEQITEDTLFALYCMARGKQIFHPVPSPIDHDLTIASTNPGFDDHYYRKPQVTWKEHDRWNTDWRTTDPEWWARTDLPDLVRHYGEAYSWLPLVLRDQAKAQRLVTEHAAKECPAAFDKFKLNVHQ